MSENKIRSGQAALDSINIGVNLLAETVGKTLGPKGRNVVIRKKHFTTVTKDGVTVAQQVFLEDPYENAGAQMVKEVALKTNQIAGDGTTTATVLAQAIVQAGLKNIASGANPMDLKRGIEFAVTKVVNFLREKSEIVGDDFEKIKQIGTISSNNDEEIGQLIADTMEEIGKDGVIYIEESRLAKNKVEIIKGIQVNQGYISPYFVTDQSSGTCVLEEPVILLYDGKITGIQPILTILDACTKQKRPLLIVADDVEGETLSSLIFNKNNGNLQCCAIKSPFGDNSKEVMRDIAISTGGDYVSEDEGLKLEYVLIDNLGTCAKVIVGLDLTTIVEGSGDKDAIESHIYDLKGRLELANSEYEQAQIKDRIAKLSMGVAVLYVGGHTESEMKEKKDRVDDALHATQAAVKEGIIPGGGVAYIRAVQSLAGPFDELSEDERVGVQIIRKVLERPLRQICENGALPADVIVEKVKQNTSWGYGFNARTEVYEDLVQTGVIDPTKVARVALENAASVATLILTTSSVIID